MCVYAVCVPVLFLYVHWFMYICMHAYVPRHRDNIAYVLCRGSSSEEGFFLSAAPEGPPPAPMSRGISLWARGTPSPGPTAPPAAGIPPLRLHVAIPLEQIRSDWEGEGPVTSQKCFSLGVNFYA